MKKMKKIIAVLTAAVISVTALVTTAFTASAKGVFDDAVTMKPLTYYSEKLDKKEVIYYKIKASSDGKINLFCGDTIGGGWVRYSLIDAATNEIAEGFFTPNCKREFKDIEKGTYYLKVVAGNSDDLFFEDLYYNFISDGKSTVSYEEPTATIALKLEKGDSFRVAVVTTDYDGKIKWTTTKKSVATISKGKVVAKGTGMARIRAYLDDGSYTEIMVIVEE